MRDIVFFVLCSITIQSLAQTHWVHDEPNAALVIDSISHSGLSVSPSLINNAIEPLAPLSASGPCEDRVSKIKLVGSAFPTPNMPGYNTYRYHLDVSGFEDDAIPYITSCFGLPTWPVILDCPGGSFFNSPLNGGPTSAGVNPEFFPFFPELEFDSYIGLADDDGIGTGVPCGEPNFVEVGSQANIYDTFIDGTSTNSDELDFVFFNAPDRCEKHTPDSSGKFFVMQITASAPPRIRMYWQVLEMISLGVTSLRNHIVGFDAIGPGVFNGFEFTPSGGSEGSQFEPFGPICSCQHEDALNYSLDNLPADSASCIYDLVGCSDENACNYLILDENQLEECDYSSCHNEVVSALPTPVCSGSNCCLSGTTWDPLSQGCVVAVTDCAADIDNNNLVGLGDLLDLLAEYGLSCESDANSNWSCGNDWYHQGKWYGTSEFGEQCWFTENLAATALSDGTSIELYDGQIGGLSYSAYGETRSEGLLYSGQVFEQSASICPVGWHVPSDIEWMALEVTHGMAEEEAMDYGYRGFYVANAMRVADEISNWDVLIPNTENWSENSSYSYSSNALGFKSRPGGYIDSKGVPYLAGYAGLWWASTLDGVNQRWCRTINSYLTRPSRESRNINYHASIRCIKDTE